MDTQIRVAGIAKESIVDGPGIRFVVFAQGCNHKCQGCHNQNTHSFQGGSVVEVDSIIKQLKANPLLDGITLSGGEPFEQAEAFGVLAQKAKALGYDVMTYTGYTYEHITNNLNKNRGWAKLFEETDVLVDGRFELEKKSIALRFRGSKNQRVIDVRRSRMNNNLIMAEV